MHYCTRCLEVDTRPNTKFDEEGVCPACRYAESLKNVDWDERKKELEEIVAFGKKNNQSGYDCIIGVSGGKDSTRQAVFVREVLGMNPLLVYLTYPPEQVSQRGVDNISNLISLGFDTITISPSPIVWKKLIMKSFMEYCNWCRSTELALFSSVPRFAIAYQIPLVWLGENVVLQLGGDVEVLGASGSDANNLRYLNTLGGGDITWLLGDGISENDVLQYCYPSVEEMRDANIRIVFLGYFWKNWSFKDNGTFSVLRGLDIYNERPELIGDYVGVSALDEEWVNFNQMIKYLKFGFGRITDYANEDIRNGILSRAEAVDLVEKYDGKCSPLYIESFCHYLGISIAEFWSTVDRFVDRKLFQKNSKGEWESKFKVGFGLI